MLIMIINFAAKSSKFLAKCQEKTRIFVSTRLFLLIFYQSPPRPHLQKVVVWGSHRQETAFICVMLLTIYVLNNVGNVVFG